jgi:autotransporter-associated beta strand protein
MAVAFSSAASAVPMAAYWDVNGPISGAGGQSPSGIWDTTSTNWTADPTGGSATIPWINDRTATFSAGTDAVGAFIVQIGSNTSLSVGGMQFEEGAVTILPSAIGASGLALSNQSVGVAAGATATIDQAIAGSVGLFKDGAGTLLLGAASIFSGPTIVNGGSLVLDFNQPSAPINDIIASTSSLTLNNPAATVGNAQVATISVAGGSSATSQTFANTAIEPGAAVVGVSSASTVATTLNLGLLTHDAGGYVTFVKPGTLTTAVTTTASNLNGIIGGWATTNSGVVAHGVLLVDDWATVDANGNVVPYTGYTDAPTTGSLHNSGVTAAANVRGSFTTDADNAGTTTDINTVKTTGFSIGLGNTLRLGQFGGILRSGTSTSDTTIGTSARQDRGTLTAGGAPNQSGEINFIANDTDQVHGSIIVECAIADNGSGAVSLIKSGPGSMKLRGHNSYSGGTYLLQGRCQVAGSEIGTANPTGFGTGPVFVHPGAEAYLSGTGSTGPANDFYVAGTGTNQEPYGAIRLSGNSLAGRVFLTDDARLVGETTTDIASARFNGPITGPHSLQFGTDASSFGIFSGSGVVISNTGNAWSGDTILVSGSSLFSTVSLGASQVIPDGAGNGNVVLGNPGGAAGKTTLDLAGFNETINGLWTAAGANVANAFVENRKTGTTSTLTVGNNGQDATFGGTLRNNPGILAVVKIGAGTQVFTGSNSYTGNTTINSGTLTIGAAGGLPFGGNVINQANFVVNGNTTAGTVSGSGTTTVGTGVTLTAAAFSQSGGLINNGATQINGGGTLGSVGIPSISGNGAITVGNGTNASTLRLAQDSGGSTQNSIIINTGSALDITNNLMLFATTPLSTIRSYVANGAINSSLASGGYGVGYASLSQGAAAEAEVKWTFLGDSNLDGTVNVADLANLAGNFGVTAGALWINGDFNYDGNVNVADLSDLAGNFGQGISSSNSDPALPAASVPEPARTAMLFPAVGVALARRRRPAARK